MNEQTSSYIASLSASAASRLDQVCTEFDRALRQGDAPKIEEFIARLGAEERMAGVRELFALELEHQLRMGRPPELSELRQRFGENFSAMKAVFLQSVLPDRIGRFQIRGVLGKGGFGRVYEGFDEQLQRKVAIKTLLLDRVLRDGQVDRLVQEARLAAKLRHPAIVGVYEIGQDDDGDYFAVLEFIEGCSLKDTLKEHRLSMQRTVDIVSRVAGAVQYAHENGLTHRDLKPGNILLDNEGRPFVTDFGLAVDETSQQLRSGEVVGTPPYMAPEQVAGETHRLDGRTDIWAIGVILYELIAGRRPFDADDLNQLFHTIRHLDPRPLRQRDARVPKQLDRIVAKCLAKRMSDRYESAFDVLQDLRQVHVPMGAPTNDESPAAADLERMAQGAGDVPSSSSRDARVIPRGLRCYGQEDQDFFLRLLPGPIDRSGIPESIRFWQRRMEVTDADETFTVGLMYGPSGCGKSSLMRAGIIPRFADPVRSVVVESTGSETELRLLKSLRKSFPKLGEDLSLPEMFEDLRRGDLLAPDQKLVVVLDQFEQWLHGNMGFEQSQLVDALRHCNGERIQVVILCRDDFWMQLTRFFRVLEVPIVEGFNSAVVDLFDEVHATNVLRIFGQAYERLPEEDSRISAEQQEFLKQGIAELSQESRVVPIRLSLFAEMLRSREWTPSELQALGGAEAVGVAFLEATFESSAAPPGHRLYAAQARSVLGRLLPPAGSDLKGHMRSEEDLLLAAGFTRNDPGFEDVVRILDSELRLITPTDPTGSESPREAEESERPSRFFQLTHDYLVPSIRTWINRRKRETRRGRAELRLSERAQAFAHQRHHRQLPSFWEWLSITLFTRGHSDNEHERDLRRASRRFHLRRLAMVSAVALLAIWGGIETVGRIRAGGLVRSLIAADTSQVSEIIEEMDGNRRWVNSSLVRLYEQGSGDSQLHAALALLGHRDDADRFVLEALLAARPERAVHIGELMAARGQLAQFEQALRNRFSDLEIEAGRRFRAAIALACINESAKANRWGEFADFVAAQLIDELISSPRSYEELVGLLAPFREELLTALTAISRGSQWADSQQVVATTVLADFFAENPRVLETLLLDSTRSQFSVFSDAIMKHRPEAEAAMRAELEIEPAGPSGSNDTDEMAENQQRRDMSANRQANAVLQLARWQDFAPLWARFASPPLSGEMTDPRVRTYLIDRYGASGLDALTFAERLAREPDPSVRAAIILALASAAERSMPEDWTDHLAHVYENDADPGAHAAARWALGRVDGGSEIVDEIDHQLATGSVVDNREWYLTRSNRHTMCIPRIPEGRVALGRIDDDPDSESDEVTPNGTPWSARFTRPFAIASTEVTDQQFIRFEPEHRGHLGADEPERDSRPVYAVTWFHAAAYCNWLSRKEGIPENQLCYTEDDNGVVLSESRSALSRYGYRLPTQSEWEYCCRAGSFTPRFYGFDPDLLDRYAWFLDSSNSRTHGVGLLWPNGLGLFDMLGNTIEWCHGKPAFRASESRRNLRGGGFKDPQRIHRSSNRYYAEADNLSFQHGFRIARTLPSAD